MIFFRVKREHTIRNATRPKHSRIFSKLFVDIRGFDKLVKIKTSLGMTWTQALGLKNSKKGRSHPKQNNTFRSRIFTQRLLDFTHYTWAGESNLNNLVYKPPKMHSFDKLVKIKTSLGMTWTQALGLKNSKKGRSHPKQNNTFRSRIFTQRLLDFTHYTWAGESNLNNLVYKPPKMHK